MIEHIVLFKIKTGITKEQIESFYEKLLEIKDEVPGIVSIKYGRNNSPENKNLGFEYGFIVRFRNSRDRDNYLPHIKHQTFAKKYFRPIAEEILVFDFSIDDK